MSRPAEMLQSFANGPDADLALDRPLTARKALAVWGALSVVGWVAIAAIVTVTLF